MKAQINNQRETPTPQPLGGETFEHTFRFTSLVTAALASGADLGKVLDGVPVRTWLLAFLTSVIDPEGVRQAESTNTLPSSVNTAMHLLSKISFFLSGQSEGMVPPEDLAEGKKMHQALSDHRRLITEHEWRLNEGQRFTLEQAVNPNECKWCKYKTVRNLKKLLKRVSFPFKHFDGEPYITKATYQKALEADRGLERKRDVERKKAGKKKIAPGNSEPGSQKLQPTSGRKGRTSGKSKATSNT